MKDKIIEWVNTIFRIAIFLSIVFACLVGLSICLGAAKSHLEQYRMEEAKTADFVMYTSDGKMSGMEHEVIIDMDTGYQYLVFHINGDYVIAPRISEDGIFYKTVE